MRRFILAAAGILLGFTAEAQQTGPFPAGAGRDIVAAACTQCHQAGPIIQLRMGEAAWRQRVYNMILRGAQIGPDEIDDVVKYLAANFGPGVPIPGPATPLGDIAGPSRGGPCRRRLRDLSRCGPRHRCRASRPAVASDCGPDGRHGRTNRCRSGQADHRLSGNELRRGSFPIAVASPLVQHAAEINQSFPQSAGDVCRFRHEHSIKLSVQPLV